MAGRPKATRSFRAKHTALYASERDCARYDTLCSRQDHAGNMLAELRSVVAGNTLASLHVVDIGTGTGKLARLLAPHVQSVSAFDRSDEMITAARAATSAANVSFAVADVRSVPLPDGCAGLVVAGWAISYLKAEHEVWHRDGSSSGPWREEVDAALAEMERLLPPNPDPNPKPNPTPTPNPNPTSNQERLLAPGGTALILETHGTACESPQRSGSWLYAHFRDRGFSETCDALLPCPLSPCPPLVPTRMRPRATTHRSSPAAALSRARSHALPRSHALSLPRVVLRLVRTDYRFASRAEALDTLLFFFGKGVAARATLLLQDAPPDAPCLVPECTLFCWRRKHLDAPLAATALPAHGTGQVPCQAAAGDGGQMRHAVARRLRGWLWGGRRAHLWLCASLVVGTLVTSVVVGMGRRRR